MLPLLTLFAASLGPLLAAAGGAAAEGGAGGATNSFVQFLPFAMIAFLAYFLFIVPQRTKEKRFQAMLDGLKENDHVVTTSGIHGVVTNIQRDANRLTLRVDDSTGTRVRVALWAIDSVLSDKPVEPAAKK
ncbi:MAG: preprotein translocase subunit YajC [Lacipirellulaceae bacterium]